MLQTWRVRSSDHRLTRQSIDGVSVRQLVTRLAASGQVAPLEHVVFIASRVARALKAAHNARDRDGAPSPTIHGSLSASRVLVSRGGEVVVTGPWAGDRPGRTDDIRVVGELLYQLVAGAPLSRRRRPRLASIAREVPAALDALVERLLDRDLARAGGIDALVADLETVAAELSATSSAAALAAWLEVVLATPGGDVASWRPVTEIPAIEATAVQEPRVARGSAAPPPTYAQIPVIVRPKRVRRRPRRQLRRPLIVLAIAALLFATSLTITMALI